jgi:hypothetical protein
MRCPFSGLLLVGSAPARSLFDLMNEPTVRAAMEAARRNEPQTLDLQVHVFEIPARPFKEEARGRELARLFGELVNVSVSVKCFGTSGDSGFIIWSSQNSTLRTRSKRFNVSDTRRNPSGHFQLPVKPIIPRNDVRPLWLFARATSKCG